MMGFTKRNAAPDLFLISMAPFVHGTHLKKAKRSSSPGHFKRVADLLDEQRVIFEMRSSQPVSAPVGLSD